MQSFQSNSSNSIRIIRITLSFRVSQHIFFRHCFCFWLRGTVRFTGQRLVNNLCMCDSREPGCSLADFTLGCHWLPISPVCPHPCVCVCVSSTCGLTHGPQANIWGNFTFWKWILLELLAQTDVTCECPALLAGCLQGWSAGSWRYSPAWKRWWNTHWTGWECWLSWTCSSAAFNVTLLNCWMEAACIHLH